MSTTNANNPRRQELDGSWSDYTYNILDVPLISARRLEFPDGRAEYIIEGRAESTRWSLHLRPVGKELRGNYVYLGETHGYPVVMRLYRAVGEDEWLLLGTWTSPGHETTQWAIALYPKPEDD